MTWARCVGTEPPDTQLMNRWESEGWQRIQILAAPATNSRTGAPVGMVFVCYLWRPKADAHKQPGFPVRLAPRNPAPALLPETN